MCSAHSCGCHCFSAHSCICSCITDTVVTPGAANPPTRAGAENVLSDLALNQLRPDSTMVTLDVALAVCWADRACTVASSSRVTRKRPREVFEWDANATPEKSQELSARQRACAIRIVAPNVTNRTRQASKACHQT